MEGNVVRSSRLKPELIRSGFSRWQVGEENSEGEQRAFCPICEDPDTSSSPSAMLNAEGDVWNCLKGNHGGSITALAKDLKKERGWDIRAEAAENSPKSKARHRSNAPKGEPPSSVAVNDWHVSLMKDDDLVDALIEHRGLSEETMEEYEIGYNTRLGRYTIPIYDADGNLVNVRQYKMGAGDDIKFLNHPGYGEARLYGVETIAGEEEIILAEGELDRLVLVQRGFTAVSGTGGSGTFKAEWAPLFTDKVVYVAYDPDDAGHKGATRVENVLRNHALVVYKIQLPGGDVTDFFVEEGGRKSDFRALMEDARDRGARSSKSIDNRPQKGRKVSLTESMSAESSGEPIELVVSVTGKSQEPFTAPRRIVATCGMDKGAACETCPMMARNGQMEVVTESHDTRLTEFIDVTSSTTHRLLRVITGARCSDRVQFDMEDLWRVEELSVQHSIDERHDAEAEMPVRRTVWSFGTYRTETNQKLRLVGTNVPDPKSGILRFQAWVNETVELDIDRFSLTPELIERLSVFRPERKESPLDRMLYIASDLAANVTQITGRDLLHVGMDLVWHSPIAFRVNEKEVDKGWVEMMVIGDTRTGKSEIATRLLEYYNSGRLISCEGVTFAGLIGGVQQINNRWHMTWGMIPMNDRRLVVLDEVSGMSDKNVIEQMSSVRSAGVAQITKIATEATSARTRLIWISNPTDGRFLSENRQGGVGALLTVVPNMEDIARFDFVMAAARGDVSAEDINSDLRPGPPEFSGEDCELLVKWSWSLTRDDVSIDEAAVAAASRHAIKMGERYIPSPPLVQAENVRYKLLRIACAIAARTFSINRKKQLHVKEIHVDDAVRFLDMIYDQPSLGYAALSTEELERAMSSVDNMGLARNLMMTHPEVFQVLHMNREGKFKLRDFQEFAGLSPETAGGIGTSLNKWGLTRYAGGGVFHMTEQLVELLRELHEEGNL